jgi:TRAP-type transport system periplasmic protein
MMMMSKAKLDSLDPKSQSVIRDTAIEMQPVWRKLVAEDTDRTTKFCQGKGIKINETDYPAFKRAMQPVYAEFRDKLGADFVDNVLKTANS